MTETVEIPFAMRRVTVRTRFWTRAYRLLTDGTYFRQKDRFGTWAMPRLLRERWPTADAIEVDMTF